MLVKKKKQSDLENWAGRYGRWPRGDIVRGRAPVIMARSLSRADKKVQGHKLHGSFKKRRFRENDIYERP